MKKILLKNLSYLATMRNETELLTDVSVLIEGNRIT